MIETLNLSHYVLIATVGWVIVQWWRLTATRNLASERTLRLGFRLGLAAWLGYSGWAAASGLLNHPNAFPPRMLFLLLPMAILLSGMLLRPELSQLTAHVSIAELTALQAFRIGAEAAIYLAVATRQMPEIMSFHHPVWHRNWDIIPAFTALPVAWVIWRGQASWLFLVGWHVFGLLCLTNVLIHGILSAPSPIRLLTHETPNVAVVEFPFVWLPAILVFTGYSFHILVLKRLLGKRQNASNDKFSGGSNVLR
jgi:hypothetical protein